MSKLLAIALIALAAPALAQSPVDTTIPFTSSSSSLDAIFAESMRPIHAATLKLEDDGGKLKGVLTLDPNLGEFNEFGDRIGLAGDEGRVMLDCSLKREKEADGRFLYSLRGPKITSKMSIVFTPGYGQARLIAYGTDKKVRTVIELIQPQPEPCHPGCFPKGSLVLVGDETRPIEKLKVGDEVTVLDSEGRATSAKIVDLFANRNKLIEIRTERGNLVSTETQPIALEGGEFKPAGELKGGDRVLRYVGAKPEATAVTEVAAFADDAQVFNVILGESTIFVVDDFQVRSKPPPVVLP